MPGGQFDLFGEPATVQDKAARRGQRFRSPDSPITERLIRSSVEIQTTPEHELTFQHTVFCQTAMPYRYPGDVRRWERTNGRVSLEMEAGRALDPRTRKFGPVPLPFGSRPRLILMHLNSVALRSGEPTIEVEDSLTAFVRTIIGRSPTGRDIGVVRDQLTALSAALVRRWRANRNPRLRQHLAPFPPRASRSQPQNRYAGVASGQARPLFQAGDAVARARRSRARDP